MFKFCSLIIFLYLTFLISISIGLYNSTQAQIGVFLSGAAYCGKDKYLSMNLTGPAKNFIVSSVLHDKSSDLEGFIGYLDSTKSIHVVFRGSSSILNWLDDLQIRQVDYISFPECKCKVHNGFYKATLNLKDETIKHVKLLQKKRHGYKVFVNGHSLGFGIGDLMSMELFKENIFVEAYGYGKPRVGNFQYSQFFNSKIIEHYRHTNNKDIVPHLPPISGLGYYHSCQEIFEDFTGSIVHCSDTNTNTNTDNYYSICEDEKCGNQYSLTQTNIDDHLYYLSHKVDCENSII